MDKKSVSKVVYNNNLELLLSVLLEAIVPFKADVYFAEFRFSLFLSELKNTLTHCSSYLLMNISTSE